jgi:hypothetical protein
MQINNKMMDYLRNGLLAVVFTTLLFQGCDDGSQTEFPSELSFQLKLKEAGNQSTSFELVAKPDGTGYQLTGDSPIPLKIGANISQDSEGVKRISISVKALESANFHIQGSLSVEEIGYDDASFLLPGFWYRKNLRSPERAPSVRVGSDWMVREDRLSIPLTGVYGNTGGKFVTICRIDEIAKDAMMPYKKGEVIIHDQTDVGSVGFKSEEEHTSLTFGYPFSEEPVTYIRKLTLAPSTMAFQRLEAGEEKVLTWEVRTSTTGSYSEFVEDTWNYAFDLFKPDQFEEKRTDEALKKALSQFYTQSYTDSYELKGFSGVHLNIDSCEKRGLLEVGFVGRVLLNAYNAAEYGYENEELDQLKMAHQIFDSYTEFGFTEHGFIREVVDDPHNYETEVYSIRRQSEGVYAILQYLKLEEVHHRTHPELTAKTLQLLDNIVSLQQEDYFPRKFNDQKEILDDAGGSTSTAIIPLLMGWKLFGNTEYLESAQRAARYVETEIIEKGDYFSSTLDANCEDKEASIYASCAMYYLGLVSGDQERSRYYQLSEKAAYFALSWYYLWDVPFAPGQMLGDLGFKTRGWGNVSVENNHVDVYIFDFADVLNHLAEINGNLRLSEMAAVIKSSMRDQLLPEEGRMCGIGKVGYHPEVVQHTNWDYGHFGKGYYNDLFAPGWVISSLWELLSEDRLHHYFLN